MEVTRRRRVRLTRLPIMVLVAMLVVTMAGCAGEPDSTISTISTGDTRRPSPAVTGPEGFTGSLPPEIDPYPRGGTTPETTWPGRRTHLRVATTPTVWHDADAFGRVNRYGNTNDGIDLPVDEIARDYWVWLDNPEHMEGIEADTDGLTQKSGGCGSVECTHVVVTPDGAVHLPNRRDRVVDSLWFRFWSIHDWPAPRRDLPPDARPLDERGERVEPITQPNLPLEVTTDPAPRPSPTPTQPLTEQMKTPPEVIVSLIARDAHHVQDVDPAGRGGFDLDAADPATPPGAYWLSLRIYSASGHWVDAADNDGPDTDAGGIARRSARCEGDGCVQVVLAPDGTLGLEDGTPITKIHFQLQPFAYPVYEEGAHAPVVGPAPTREALAAPAGSVVVAFRLGAAGEADPPAVHGYGATLVNDDRSFEVNPYLTRDVSTIVFTDVPPGDYLLKTAAGLNVSNLSFTDDRGLPPPYAGVTVHVTGGDPMVVTLLGRVPPRVP